MSKPKLKKQTPKDHVSIETAMEALRDLIQYIECDIICDYESAQDDPENDVEGWKPTDNVDEFLKSLGDDGFRRKLINMGLCVYPGQ